MLLMALNDKQLWFANNYINHGANGRAAAIAAGYSPATAAVRACGLLKRPEVIDIVEGHRAAVLGSPSRRFGT
jgi:phage terminase small subunit